MLAGLVRGCLPAPWLGQTAESMHAAPILAYQPDMYICVYTEFRIMTQEDDSLVTVYGALLQQHVNCASKNATAYAASATDLPFGLQFPWAFRWRSCLLVSGSSIATGLLLRALRNLLDWSQQARQRQHQLRPSFRPS